jgi:membrane-associated phospholipid phosphatase
MIAASGQKDPLLPLLSKLMKGLDSAMASNVVTVDRDAAGRAQLARAPEFLGDQNAGFAAYKVPFYRTLAIIVGLLIVAEIPLCRAVHLYRGNSLLQGWPIILFLCAYILVFSKVRRIVEVAESIVLALVLPKILSLLIQISGRNHRPLADVKLAAIDALCHFRTAQIVYLVKKVPAAEAFFQFNYGLMTALMLAAALVIPALIGRVAYSHRFVLGTVIAAVVAALVFRFWPAVGPWTVEAFNATKEQAEAARSLVTLRSGLPLSSDMVNSDIVSFPSFHVVLAVLSAWALGCVRLLRPLAWIVCAFICVSTITTGWHYGIDVLGGLVVAAGAIALSAWIVRIPPALGN